MKVVRAMKIAENATLTAIGAPRDQRPGVVLIALFIGRTSARV